MTLSQKLSHLTIRRDRVHVSMNYFLICVYFFNAIFIPYDNFGLKKLSFALLILFNLSIVLNGMFSKNNAQTILILSFLFPIYTIAKSSLITGNFSDNFLSGYTGMILLIFYVTKHFKLDIVPAFINTLILLAVFVDVSVLLDLIGVQSIYENPILSWMYSTHNANIGKGIRYTLWYYIFIKTTPMLLIALGYSLSEKKYFVATIVLIALLLSGTRANSALALVTFSIGFLTSEQNTKSIKTMKRKIILVLILVIVGSYVLIAQGLWDRYLES